MAPPRIVTSPMSPIEFSGADRESGISKSVTVMWNTGIPFDYGEVFYRVNNGSENRFDDPSDLLESSKVFTSLKFGDRVEFSLRSSFTHVELVTLTVGTCDELASSPYVYKALSRQRMRMDGWLRARTW